MANQIKQINSQTVIFLVIFTFIAGFISGVAFSVFKNDGNDTFKHEKAATNPTGSKDPHTEAKPETFQDYVMLGNHYFDNKVYSKAISSYEGALKIKPNSPNVLTDLGIMYRKSGDSAKAVELFRKATAVDPSHETSRFNAGVVLFHDLKKKNEAIEAWEGLLKMNPEAKAPSGESVKSVIDHYKAEK